MIPNNQKTSLLIPSQLPGFIKDDPNYTNFVAFLQSYYEWLETSGNVTDASKNILNYSDIDTTSSQFLQYFYDEFLKYFPQDVIVDRSRVIKIAKELYKAKGTPASFKFLFRILYNTGVDFFFTKDVVLRASAGKWYVTNSLNVLSTDTTFLNAVNYTVFGETTQSIGIVENVINTGSKMQIYISNIERQFQSGETIRIVDSNKQDIYWLNGKIVSADTPNAYVLSGKVVGQINKVNFSNQGSLYQAGDPLVFYGGLTSSSGIGASAFVTGVSSGSIQSITVSSGGYGYRAQTNTSISIATVGATTQPSATVFSLNPANSANVAFLTINTLDSGNLMSVVLSSNNYSSNTRNFPNLTSCASNTTLANALSFIAFQTNPISSLTVTSGGVGIQSISSITATSLYPTSNVNYQADLSKVGILAPIQILNGGKGYRNNDTILISGGPGYGAYANVISVNPANSNTITAVSYVFASNTKSQLFPLGGMGYQATSLPTATVSSANATAYGASLVIPGVLGTGATFQSVVSGVGKINGVTITNYGQDYSSLPLISLAVQDVIVSGVDLTNLPTPGDLLFQSPDNTLPNAAYFAYFDSIVPVSISSNPASSLYRIRLYEYNGSSLLKYGTTQLIDSVNLATFTIANYNSGRFVKGILTYGDGQASASATFTNGLFKSQGQYVDTTGQPSGSDVLQSSIYNNYTYEILVQKEIEKYRKILLGLLHPSGMKVLGRYVLSSANNRIFNLQSGLYSGHTLAYYMGTPGVVATMNTAATSAETYTTNTIKLTNIPSGTNLANIFFANATTVRLSSDKGDSVISLVTGVNTTTNVLTLQANTFLTYQNVATVKVIAGTNTINILSLTGLYKYYKDSNYSNTMYPMMDIIKVGDSVTVSNNPTLRIVTSVDYVNNIVTVNSNYIFNAGNGASANITVVRPFTTNSAAYFQVFGPTGIVYIPELVTESGITLITEDGNTILLG